MQGLRPLDLSPCLFETCWLLLLSLVFRPAVLTDHAQCNWEVGSDISRSRLPGLTCQWCWPCLDVWWPHCSCDVGRGMAHPGPCAPGADRTPDPGLCRWWWCGTERPPPCLALASCAGKWSGEGWSRREHLGHGEREVRCSKGLLQEALRSR